MEEPVLNNAASSLSSIGVVCALGHRRLLDRLHRRRLRALTFGHEPGPEHRRRRRPLPFRGQECGRAGLHTTHIHGQLTMRQPLHEPLGRVDIGPDGAAGLARRLQREFQDGTRLANVDDDRASRVLPRGSLETFATVRSYALGKVAWDLYFRRSDNRSGACSSVG